MRLFLAICFDNAMKQGLADTGNDLMKHLTRGKMTRPENFHLTLIFIGETTRVSDIKKAMDDVRAPGFELAIDGLGKFSGRGSAIYWLGVRKNQALESLYQTLKAALLGKGFAIEQRPFQPHLTLFREALPEAGFSERRFSEGLAARSMHVSKIDLMKSERINGRLVYTSIYEKKLLLAEESTHEDTNIRESKMF